MVDAAHLETLAPGLWLVATPLGNIEDMPPRGRRVLEQADAILAEDTRRTGLLLQKLGVAARSRLESFHDHNEQARTPDILQRLADGAAIALVSDAGTPLVSDPGYRLTAACRKAGLDVRPAPGPSAILAALACAGLPPHPFTFLGFLPRKHNERCKTLERHKHTGATLVLFERKSRVLDTLLAAYDALGPRQFCIARELTKTHEEFINARLGCWNQAPGMQEQLDSLLGEITLVIGPEEESGAMSATELEAVIHDEQTRGGKPKETARRVSERAPGWTAKAVYEHMQRLRRKTGPEDQQ